MSAAADSAYIDDGFTEDSYIAAVPGLHPAVRFQFRPLLVAERSAWWNEQERRGDRHTATGEMLAKKVQTWDLKDRKGETLNPRDAAVYLRLRPRLFDRLLAIVSGQEPGDPDPLRGGEASGMFDQGATAKN